MSNRVSLEVLRDVLTEEGVETTKQQKILDHLQEILDEEKKDKESEKVPKSKNEFGVVLFVSDLVSKEYTACIYQVKEGYDKSTVLKNISDAAKNQNDAAKKKKNIITTMGEAFQYLKRKWVKEQGISLKTKTPIEVIISDNKLV